MELLWIQFFIVISTLIHEIGHFLAAKLFGIKVDEFSIGSGPVLFKSSKFGTQFVLKLIPINGHINVDIDIPKLTRAERFAMAGVALAGPAINVLTAILVLRFSPLFALASFFSGVGNMLPLPGWDGQQVLAYLYSAFTYKGE